jgi:hypothetical protein
MATIAQNQTTTFQRVSKNDLMSAKFDLSSALKDQCEMLPDVFNIFIVPAEMIDKPKKKIATHANIKKISDYLPIMNLMPKQEESAKEGFDEIKQGKYKRMTSEEFKNRN